MFYYLPPVPKRSQKITLLWSNNSGGDALSYFSQLLFLPLHFSFIYIFLSLPSQRPHYSRYQTGRWHSRGFFWNWTDLCWLEHKALLVQSPDSCSSLWFNSHLWISSSKKSRSGSAGAYTLKKAQDSAEGSRKQPTLRRASLPPDFWHDAAWMFHFPWKWR